MGRQQRVGHPESGVAQLPRVLPARLTERSDPELEVLLADSRERERRLTEDVAALAAALRDKDYLVATVAHELRTPLTSIVGNLDLLVLETPGLTPDAGRWLEIARRNAARLSAMVSDLLVSADSTLPVHPRPTDLAALIEASLGSAQGYAEASRVSLAMDVPAPLWAEVDPLRIGQVMDNLVSNAIKYTPEGGTVRVTARLAGDRVLLQVQDSGMGITAADADRVFSRFFRSPAVAGGPIPGAGLGLCITKAIVERHGGAISVSSIPGRGSTFTVDLPAPADAPAP